MSSTRLPGKVMREVLGKPLLGYLLERVKRVRNADEVVVATTVEPEDQQIAEYCQSLGVRVFRGSKEDVLDRYLKAAIASAADVVVRVTGDCPLIDPLVIEQVIGQFLEGGSDYVGNTLKLTFPRGMDTEVFSLRTLEKAAEAACEEREREHVTYFIYKHPELFKLKNVPYSKNVSQLRLTVDTADDFQLIKTVFEMLYQEKPHFSLEDLLTLFEMKPELQEINAHVSQKAL